MEFICPVCGEPLFFNEDRGKYEAYEIFGHWSCSRACAIKQEYALGTIKKGLQCAKCLRIMGRDIIVVVPTGKIYCDEVCMTLDLIDKGELKVQEVTEEELAKKLGEVE